MTDIALQDNQATRTCDIAVGADADLVADDGLDTAVMLSLYLDRRAAEDDDIPDGTDNRRGYWADTYTGEQAGSRLWLLSRAKETQDTLLRAEAYAGEALQWLLDDGAAKAVNISASRVRAGVLGLDIEIIKPDGGLYQKMWEYQLNA